MHNNEEEIKLSPPEKANLAPSFWINTTFKEWQYDEIHFNHNLVNIFF